jgi:hypothetical protein
MAKISFGGWIQQNIYYWDQSSEQSAGGVVQNAVNTDNGREAIQFNGPAGGNRFYVRYHSDDGKIFGMIQMRQGGPDNSKGATTWESAYIDYTFNDMFHVRIGKESQSYNVPPAVPFSLGDCQMAHLFMFGYGYNNPGGSSTDGVKGFIKFNDNIRMEILLHDPIIDNAATEPISGWASPTSSTGAPTEETVLPFIDIALPMNFGSFKFEPSFTWRQSEYDQVTPGDEDTIDRWGINLWGSYGMGPITIRAAISYSENLQQGGAPSHSGVGAPVGYADAGGFMKIADGESTAGWIILGYNFGPATLNIGYGHSEDENEVNPATNADDMERDRNFYGVALEIPVAGGLTIMPEVSYWEDDDSGLDGANNPLTRDYGNQVFVGVQFTLRF